MAAMFSWVSSTVIVCDWALEFRKVLMTVPVTLNSTISMSCSVSLSSVEFATGKRKYLPRFLTHSVPEGTAELADDLDVVGIDDMYTTCGELLVNKNLMIECDGCPVVVIHV